MKIDEALIRDVVTQVLQEVTAAAKSAGTHTASSNAVNAGRWANAASVAPRGHVGRRGQFTCVDQAVEAAQTAFDQLSTKGLEQRREIVDIIRKICSSQAEELGGLEFQETKIGRLEHKIEKLVALDHPRVPGVEFLRPQTYSGDHGLAVIERAPFGVIGAITPVTHSLPTLACNAISMISAGNALIANPHPSGKKIAAEGVRRFNEAIFQKTGIDNLICVITEPTLESANAIFAHRGVALVVVTGGPAVARAALKAGKRAVVAGPGNPPVVVDETADLSKAARSIILGASYDNNLLCIAEKEVFVVDQVFDRLMDEMERAGAVRLRGKQVDQMTAVAFVEVGDDKHLAPAKELLGQDAVKMANAIGLKVDPRTPLLFGETDEHNPFVSVEQMMTFVPFVRCGSVEQAIDLAKHYEHGYRHTSLIHSNNVRNITRMGKLMDTTLFVKNGPCMAGLGMGGEGYASFSIAGPTGEGITTPLTFTRERRCSMIDDLWILGQPRSEA
jgi:aldehyde dehydrogenase